MSFGCERSCSSIWGVSNFNSKVPHGGIYPHTKFERDPLNTFRVRVFTSSGSTGGRGGDAKTIISPNTSFGDIIRMKQDSKFTLSVGGSDNYMVDEYLNSGIVLAIRKTYSCKKYLFI